MRSWFGKASFLAAQLGSLATNATGPPPSKLDGRSGPLTRKLEKRAPSGLPPPLSTEVYVHVSKMTILFRTKNGLIRAICVCQGLRNGSPGQRKRSCREKMLRDNFIVLDTCTSEDWSEVRLLRLNQAHRARISR